MAIKQRFDHLADDRFQHQKQGERESTMLQPGSTAAASAIGPSADAKAPM